MLDPLHALQATGAGANAAYHPHEQVSNVTHSLYDILNNLHFLIDVWEYSEIYAIISGLICILAWGMQVKHKQCPNSHEKTWLLLCWCHCPDRSNTSTKQLRSAQLLHTENSLCIRSLLWVACCAHSDGQRSNMQEQPFFMSFYISVLLCLSGADEWGHSF